MSREDAPTRERGRPARMHSRYVPLSFPGGCGTWHSFTNLSHFNQPRTSRPVPKSLSGGRKAMSWEDAPTRERGRPARIHSRYVPLSFPGGCGTGHSFTNLSHFNQPTPPPGSLCKGRMRSVPPADNSPALNPSPAPSKNPAPATPQQKPSEPVANRPAQPCWTCRTER